MRQENLLMAGYEDDVRARIAEVVGTLGVAADRSRVPRTALFQDLPYMRRTGRGWTVRFEGRTVAIPDGAGIQYLAALLDHPDRSRGVQAWNLHRPRGAGGSEFDGMSEDELGRMGMHASSLAGIPQDDDAERRIGNLRGLLREARQELDDAVAPTAVTK